MRTIFAFIYKSHAYRFALDTISNAIKRNVFRPFIYHLQPIVIYLAHLEDVLTFSIQKVSLKQEQCEEQFKRSSISTAAFPEADYVGRGKKRQLNGLTKILTTLPPPFGTHFPRQSASNIASFLGI